MKNNIFIFTVFILLTNATTQSMQKPASRWKGRGILMGKDPQTQKWRVLLAHRPVSVDPNDVWADFDEESRGGERGNEVAARAVNAQTNNVFKVSPGMTQYGVEGQKPAAGGSGDWFQFIPLGVPGNPPFISGKDLYNRATNKGRDDFIWVDADKIINNQPIMHSRTHKQITISRGVLAALRNLLPGAINALNQKISGGQPAAQPSPAGVQQVVLNPLAMRAPWGPGKAGYIYFYHSGKPYYEFTNFYANPIILDGKQWPTSEHYFQAQKYPSNQALKERIRNAASPRGAFNITREPVNDRFKDPNWDNAKYQAMLKAVRAKFSQPPLKNTLLNTGNAVLVEDAGANDQVWGAGADYKGTNHLGRILMHVRDELRTGAQKSYVP